MLSCPRGLSSKGRDASTNRHNNDSIELEVKTATWLLWAPQASESTDKEENYCAGGVTDPDYQDEISSTMEARKSMSRIQEIP